MEGDITKKTRGYRTKSTAEDSRLELGRSLLGFPRKRIQKEMQVIEDNFNKEREKVSNQKITSKTREKLPE